MGNEKRQKPSLAKKSGRQEEAAAHLERLYHAIDTSIAPAMIRRTPIAERFEGRSFKMRTLAKNPNSTTRPRIGAMRFAGARSSANSHSTEPRKRLVKPVSVAMLIPLRDQENPLKRYRKRANTPHAVAEPVSAIN